MYRYLTSLPQGVSDGFLVRRNLPDQEKTRVIQSFLDHVESNYAATHSLFTLKEHLSFSEPPSLLPTQVLTENGYVWLDNTVSKLPCTFVVDLEKPFKEKIFSSMAKNLRNRIRHAGKSGAYVIIDRDFAYYNDFVDMHIEMVKKFDMVTKKEDYLQILKIFREKMKLFVCLVDSETVTALLCYYTPTSVYASIGPYNTRAREIQNNTLPLCAAIRDACESGYQYFDMGGTSTETLATYKEKFAARRILQRIYTKEFSRRKTIANTVFESGKRLGKKIFGPTGKK